MNILIDDGGGTLDVLAVGAHPDDVEIACGGTLARLAALGHRVGVVDLSDGEPTPNSPGPEVRLREAVRAGEILGLAHRVVLDLPNRRIFDDFPSRIALARVIRRLRPKLVLGFGVRTVMASPDHYQAAQLTDAAVFYGRLTKWDEHFDHLPPHAVSAQLAFPLALHSLDQAVPQSAASVVADVSDTLHLKLEAVAAYRTQFDGKPRVLRLVDSLARFAGHAAGFEAGEIFHAYRAAGTADLLAWACPPAPTPANPRAPRSQGSS